MKKQSDSVTMEILDANDQVISAYTGKEPERKPNPNLPWWLRGGSSKPTTAQGLNNFTWDLTYPGATVFDGIIIWSGRPQRGPKAPPGNYKIRMTAGSYTQTYPFTIKMDPNLKGVTDADLKSQYDLAVKIRNKESEANEAVIKIRRLRTEVNKSLEEVSDPQVIASAKAFLEKIKVIEVDLYQVKNQSGQDPLNFPIKLNNRLSSLRRSIETGDAKPTDASYKVFEELSAELTAHLNKLDAAMNSDFANFNKNLSTKIKIE
jgi:hypothetical protein